MSDSLPKAQKFEFYLDQNQLFVNPPLRRLRPGDPDPLALSITKWETIVDLLEQGHLVHSDGGSRTCALCQVKICSECPICEFTHRVECRGTPYGSWMRLPRDSDLSERLRIAREEVAFLKELQQNLALEDPTDE